MTKSSERLLAFAFGVVFVIVLLILASAVPHPTPFQYTVFRIVLALAAGGVAAMIPGFITIDIPKVLRAGGALAVFVIVYFYSPAALTGVTVKTEQELEIEKPLVSSQPNASLPTLVVTNSAQLMDAAVWGQRYQSVTIDGVKAELPTGSVILANEVSALRGGSFVGRDITIVARRMANVEIDVSGKREPPLSAGSVRLFVKVIENSRVLAEGAAGTPGAAGTAGVPGSDGAKGRDGNCDGFGRYRGADAGGNGGDGGNGGNGQPGTDGQPGGTIVVATVINPVSSRFEVRGGPGGAGGAGGAAGVAGRAGVGGRGCTGLGGSQSNAPDGVAGRPGQPGQAGTGGSSGAPGEYRLVLTPSFDSISSLIKPKSNAELYSALPSI